MQLPRALKVIDQAFKDAGFEVRLVGGAVRDLVLGVTPKDWDMATPARPEKTMEILETIGRPYDLSNGHGTVSIVLEDETYEITTLRVDAETDGRHAKVEFVTDWELDAGRRDFTINAMSMDLDGTVYDYFGGQLDLERKRLRFVGRPVERIVEDYLRILRFFRFGARFDLTLDSEAVHLCRYHREGLKQISGERIWAEMQKLLEYPNSTKYVDVMKERGVWDIIVDL